MVETPELNRMRAITDKSESIGQFLDWLQNERGLDICGMDVEGVYYPINRSINQLLAEYFQIDLQKVEAEKSALLEEQRALNARFTQRLNARPS